jgi:UDP-N-acetylmuramoyl-L-alanyl-D-glutamate--2,6-diaminopimelate ligase
MGQALFQGCDVSIFTSDNPRSESADSILKEMISGLDLGQKGEVCIDRREAISLAVNKANAGDVVLIMGKGHESGQEINGVITPFDDRLELTQAILKQGNK